MEIVGLCVIWDAGHVRDRGDLFSFMVLFIVFIVTASYFLLNGFLRPPYDARLIASRVLCQLVLPLN